MADQLKAPSRDKPDTHQRGAEKVARIPVKVEPTTEVLRKPSWIRAKAPAGKGVARIKQILRERKLSSVCEEALCPNLGECFSHGTATFMIMGDICTRRCPFCDVAHGKPQPLDTAEPRQLAEAIAEMALSYVVITSVTRDDLPDGGAACAAADGYRLKQQADDPAEDWHPDDFALQYPGGSREHRHMAVGFQRRRVLDHDDAGLNRDVLLALELDLHAAEEIAGKT